MSNKIEDIFFIYRDKLEYLNAANDMFTLIHRIVPLKCNFNYEMLSYNKGYMEHHFFTGDYDFSNITTKVFNASLGTIYFLLDDTIRNPIFLNTYRTLAEELCTEPDIDEILSHIYSHSFTSAEYDKLWESLSGELIDNDFVSSDNFRFNNIECIGVDNNNKCINYYGAFFGDQSGLEMVDQGMAYMNITLSCAKSKLPFYKDLLLDASIHLEERNFKMATFNAFAAFECFVNMVSGRSRITERLIEKFPHAYDSKLFEGKPLTSFDVYAKLRTYYKKQRLASKRNDIAHGNDTMNWNSFDAIDIATDMYMFASLAILCYEKSFKTFSEFTKYMKLNNMYPD